MFAWFEIVALSFEASSVVQKRLVKIGRGGTASLDESRLMVTEKAQAALETMCALMDGETFVGMVNRYRALVAANEIRLSR